MRTILFLVIAFLSQVARADRISVVSASATYWTTTDSVDVVVWFDSVPDIPADYFSFAGWREPGQWPPVEMFGFRSDGRVGSEIRAPFSIQHIDYDARGEIVGSAAMGIADVSISGRVLTASIPFSTTGLASPLFDFSVSFQADGDISRALSGSSAIDSRTTYAPEPSSVTLAAIGVAILSVCLRRPRFRLAQ